MTTSASPVRITFLAGLGEIGRICADSTNAEEPGHTASETSVGRVLGELFAGQADHHRLLRQPPSPPGTCMSTASSAT